MTNILWVDVTSNYPELKTMTVEFHRLFNKARMTKGGVPRVIRKTTFKEEYRRLTSPRFTEEEIMDALSGRVIIK